MNDFLVKILETVTSSVTDRWSDRYRKRHDAREDFQLFIAQKRSLIPQRDAWGFYSATKTEIRAAIVTVQHFLKPAKSAALESLWVEYDKISYHDLSPDHEAGSAIAFNKRFAPDLKTPRELLTGYMNEFYKIAK